MLTLGRRPSFGRSKGKGVAFGWPLFSFPDWDAYAAGDSKGFRQSWKSLGFNSMKASHALMRC